jgi:hypothetical protein
MSDTLPVFLRRWQEHTRDSSFVMLAAQYVTSFVDLVECIVFAVLSEGYNIAQVNVELYL